MLLLNIGSGADDGSSGGPPFAGWSMRVALLQVSSGSQVPISTWRGATESYAAAGVQGQAAMYFTIRSPGQYYLTASDVAPRSIADIAAGRGIGHNVLIEVLLVILGLVIFGPAGLLIGGITAYRRHRARRTRPPALGTRWPAWPRRPRWPQDGSPGRRRYTAFRSATTAQDGHRRLLAMKLPRWRRQHGHHPRRRRPSGRRAPRAALTRGSAARHASQPRCPGRPCRPSPPSRPSSPCRSFPRRRPPARCQGAPAAPPGRRWPPGGRSPVIARSRLAGSSGAGSGRSPPASG